MIATDGVYTYPMLVFWGPPLKKNPCKCCLLRKNSGMKEMHEIYAAESDVSLKTLPTVLKCLSVSSFSWLH